jgi:hypothetical protein
MEHESFGQQIKRTTKKVLKITIIVIVLVGIAVLSYMYWGVYERGVMAGKVLRISEKGVMFKTYEGKINLETFGALKGANPIAESFVFCVVSNKKELIKELEVVALSGERVNLNYIKRYVKFPWRGDTKYFVTKIERAP